MEVEYELQEEDKVTVGEPVSGVPFRTEGESVNLFMTCSPGKGGDVERVPGKRYVVNMRTGVLSLWDNKKVVRPVEAKVVVTSMDVNAGEDV